MIKIKNCVTEASTEKIDLKEFSGRLEKIITTDNGQTSFFEF